MKHLKYALMGTSVALATILSSCVSDGDETFVVTPGTDVPAGPVVTTRVVSSSESAVLTSGPYSLHVPYGSVPRTNSDADGRVAFSISTADELPAELPAGYTPAGTCIKAEPMGFTFESPLIITLPAGGTDRSRTRLLRYNEYTGSWDEIPYTVKGSTIEASVIDLGYFIVATAPETASVGGGLRIAASQLDPEYFYYLTINNPGTESIRIAFAPNGSDLLMTGAPIGEYYVTVSRSLRADLDHEPDHQAYIPNIPVKVRNALTPVATGGYGGYTGWTEITLPQDDWIYSRPTAWGNTTVTYGTGKFQATLTWVNPSESNHTDYDLHLFGPSTHVYFSDKRSGAFELDRDWISAPGNAVENIYSVSDAITPGTYTVKVHLYGGVSGRRYNCRVIIDGVVIKSVAGSISSTGQFDEICSFDIVPENL